jgi:hypothetical protein
VNKIKGIKIEKKNRLLIRIDKIISQQVTMLRQSSDLNTPTAPRASQCSPPVSFGQAYANLQIANQ